MTGLGPIRRSYARKFALALLALVVVVAGVGGFLYLETGDQLHHDVRTDLTQTTDLRASELDTWLASVKDQAKLVSAGPVVQSGDTGEITDKFKTLVETDSVAEGVVAVHYLDTADMRIVTSSTSKMVGVSPREQGAAFATNPPTFDGPNDVAVTKPFRVPAVDFPVVAVISPVPGAEHRAVIMMINLEQRMASIASNSDNSRMIVVNEAGSLIAHPDSSRILTDWTVDGSQEILRDARTGTTGFLSRGGQVSAYAPLETNDWTVVYSVPQAQAFALQQQIGTNILLLILFTLVGVAGIGLTIGRTTVRALRDLATKADAMANGDLHTELNSDRGDEIGTLVRSVDDMRRSLRQQISEAEAATREAEAATADAEAAREDAETLTAHVEAKADHYRSTLAAVADGDLSQRVDSRSRSAPMSAIGDAINETVAELEETIASVTAFAESVDRAAGEVATEASQVREAGTAVTDAIEDITEGAQAQRESATEASGDLDDLSASAEEIAATAGDLAERSNRAADAGDKGRDAAEAALEAIDPIGDRIEAAIDDIESLEAEVDAIVETTDVISEIAAETNMLALNASIEAARTDGGGEGFAVVADEVKNLAEETQEAAGRIETRIESVQESTQDTVTEIRETGDRIVDGIETVEAAITSLEEVAAAVDDINRAVQEIDHATDQQARSTEATVATMDDVASVSEQTRTRAVSVSEAAQQQAATLNTVDDRVRTLSERATDLLDRLDTFRVSDGSTTRQGAMASSD